MLLYSKKYQPQYRCLQKTHYWCVSHASAPEKLLPAHSHTNNQSQSITPCSATKYTGTRLSMLNNLWVTSI